MSEQYAVAGLKRKRNELVSQIAEAEAHVMALTAKLVHLDATLTMLEPDIVLEGLPEKPRQRVKRGANTRPILVALHQAQKPMHVKDLARALLVAQGKPGLRVTHDATEATRQALRWLKRRGQVRSAGMEGAAQTWALAGDGEHLAHES